MVLSFQYSIHHGATKWSSLRIEQCVWIYTICPCNARAPVGQLIWVSAFSKPRFRLTCNKTCFLSYNIWNLCAKNVAWSKPHSFACAFSTPALFWRCAFLQNFATVESAAPYFWVTLASTLSVCRLGLLYDQTGMHSTNSLEQCVYPHSQAQRMGPGNETRFLIHQPCGQYDVGNSSECVEHALNMKPF